MSVENGEIKSILASIAEREGQDNFAAKVQRFTHVRERGDSMPYQTLQFCAGCDKRTAQLMNNGRMTCSICGRQRVN
jgi:NADH pyrophosphatase NudC (nudix superfamily)